MTTQNTPVYRNNFGDAYASEYGHNLAEQSNCFRPVSSMRRDATIDELGYNDTKNPYVLKSTSDRHNPSVKNVWNYTSMRPVIPSNQTYNPLKVRYWLPAGNRVEGDLSNPAYDKTIDRYGTISSSYGNTLEAGPQHECRSPFYGHAYGM